MSNTTEEARSTLLATYRAGVNQFGAASLAIAAAIIPEFSLLNRQPLVLYPVLSLTLGVSAYALLRAIAWAQLSRVALLEKVSSTIITVPDLHCYLEKKTPKDGWHWKLVSSEKGTILVPIGGSLIAGGFVDAEYSNLVFLVSYPVQNGIILLSFVVGAVLLAWGIYAVHRKSKEPVQPCYDPAPAKPVSGQLDRLT